MTDPHTCIFLKPENTEKKVHIVEVLPIITSNLVHHIVVFRCFNGAPESGIFRNTCYMSPMLCKSLVATWGPGDSSLTYPPHVGMLFGEEMPILMLQIHWSNPHKNSGKIPLVYVTPRSRVRLVDNSPRAIIN